MLSLPPAIRINHVLITGTRSDGFKKVILEPDSPLIYGYADRDCVILAAACSLLVDIGETRLYARKAGVFAIYRSWFPHLGWQAVKSS